MEEQLAEKKELNTTFQKLIKDYKQELLECKKTIQEMNDTIQDKTAMETTKEQESVVEKKKTDKLARNFEKLVTQFATNESKIQEQLATINQLTEEKSAMVEDHRAALDRCSVEIQLRKDLEIEVRELKGSVLVCARVRPRLACETISSGMPSDIVTMFRDEREIMLTQKGGNGIARFEFDQVFSPMSSQKDVCEIAKDVVPGLLRGQCHAIMACKLNSVPFNLVANCN